MCIDLRAKYSNAVNWMDRSWFTGLYVLFGSSSWYSSSCCRLSVLKMPNFSMATLNFRGICCFSLWQKNCLKMRQNHSQSDQIKFNWTELIRLFTVFMCLTDLWYFLPWSQEHRLTPGSFMIRAAASSFPQTLWLLEAVFPPHEALLAVTCYPKVVAYRFYKQLLWGLPSMDFPGPLNLKV